jgi:catechol 2,3-dioxygenase-like lactoylglutathione lyase family enzyme
MTPNTLDHVALWVADRDTIAEFLTTHTDMHVIDRTDAFTLVGTDARRGKLTLFAAEGPRGRGHLAHIALRVSDLDRAAALLPSDARVDRPRDGEAYVDVAEGLRIGLVEAPTDVEHDLDHVALYSGSPVDSAAAWRRLGLEDAGVGPSGNRRLEVGGAFVELVDADVQPAEKPLLNHLAVLVDSADDHLAEARDIGVEVADVVDAANTYAVFVWGPERVKLEYVEHKPSFSLT